jgi:hypothetical protein
LVLAAEVHGTQTAKGAFESDAMADGVGDVYELELTLIQTQNGTKADASGRSVRVCFACESKREES